MTETMTVRLPRTTLDRLAALARSTRRTRSFLAAEAIAEYVAVNAWQVEEIRKAVVEADAGGAFHDHRNVMDYLERRGRGERPVRPKAAATLR